MKVLSYNINDSEQWKIDRLFEMGADVYVVPEITCPEQATLPEGYDIAWNGITWNYRGQDKWKGLGIIPSENWGVVRQRVCSYLLSFIQGDDAFLH